MNRLKQLGRVVGVALLAAVLVTGSLYLLRHPILRTVGNLLTHVDPIETSEVIVVLSGGEDTRPFHAAELYAAGAAPLVVLLEEEPKPTVRLGLVPSMTEVTLGVLARAGVPEDAIRLLSEDRPVTSTRDEAAVIRRFVEEHGISDFIVVTSPFHTARARYTFAKALDGVPVRFRMAAAPEWLYDPERWWETESGVRDYGMEILKWIHTLRVLN